MEQRRPGRRRVRRAVLRIRPGEVLDVAGVKRAELDHARRGVLVGHLVEKVGKVEYCGGEADESVVR